jgi:hypothetical protein
MRHIFLSASLLLIAVSVYGETDNAPPQPCTLKFSQAPAVRGVKLGMTVDELLLLFPGSSDSDLVKYPLARADGFPQWGETSFGLNPSNWGNKERFTGITEYFFRFFDRRVVLFSARYERFPKGARWSNTDDLIQRFSDSFHLPGPKEWEPEPSGVGKHLKCDGFEVVVTGDDQGAITFYTRGWEGTKKEREAAFEEQKRHEFNP